MGRISPLICMVLVAFVALGGCRKKQQDRPAQGPTAKVRKLPPISITRQRSLVFTFRQGAEFRTVSSMDEIPLGARGWVRVQDPRVRNIGSEYVYVADLRKANDRGEFPYRVLLRQRFLQGAPLPGGTMGPAAMGAVAALGVVLYSRPGCGACDSARAYLKQRGISFTEKNIQADAAAAQELKEKAAKKGFPAGVVPVIEVAGEIVIGFDVRKLESLLRRRV